MVRSFNFSEMDIVRFFTAGLIGIDVARYINNRSSKQEVDRLIENLHVVLDDVEVEKIDNDDPLYDLESYIEKYKPEVVYIEGIDCKHAHKYSDVFTSMQNLTKTFNLQFELSFVNLPVDNSESIITQTISYFGGK